MNAKLVTYYKESKYVYYKLNEETLQVHLFIRELLYNELDKTEKLKNDFIKTNKRKLDGLCCESIERNRHKIKNNID